MRIRIKYHVYIIVISEKALNSDLLLVYFIYIYDDKKINSFVILI
jgi:hypothetical protein